MLAGEAAMALENARLYDEIRHQALHDGLTGLANRVLFRDRLEHAVERSRRSGAELALLFIDLDDFKVLNDTHGHARGDDILGAVAERVRSVLRPIDTAARLGGDEFAVLLEDVRGESGALAVATRIAESLRQPVVVGTTPIRVAASIGVAMGSGDETADDLLRNADVAMYAAKRSSRGGAEIFRPSLRDGAAERAVRAERLRGVEERDELRLDYQPIVELATGAIVAVEALVRWQPPDAPVLMPGEWIDLAEETGDIVPIGRWILREACRQARDWQIRLERPDLRMSVNLSARQFLEHDIVATVRTVLEETGLPPASLVLEITESGLMRRTASTIARLDALRDSASISRSTTSGRLLVAQLPRALPDRHPEDRPDVRSSTGANASPIARAVIDLGGRLISRSSPRGSSTPNRPAGWPTSAAATARASCTRVRWVGRVRGAPAEGEGLGIRAETPATGEAASSGDEDRQSPRLRLISGD
jgi:diguanylate cyclase (GGDEF)-like protein